MNTQETYKLTMPTDKATAQERLNKIKINEENSEDQVFLDVISLKETNGATEVELTLSSPLSDPFPFFDLVLYKISPLSESVEKVG